MTNRRTNPWIISVLSVELSVEIILIILSFWYSTVDIIAK